MSLRFAVAHRLETDPDDLSRCLTPHKAIGWLTLLPGIEHLICCDMNRHLTVLIVEDLPDDVLLLRKAMTRSGITNPIQVVEDGREAIAYLQGEGKYANRMQYPFPSVIFTDLKMPRMSGFEVLEWLRQHPDCSVIPVIILTASRQDEDVKRAYLMGANAYLVKPTSLADLESMVKTAYDFWAWCEKPHVSGNC